jgi:mono/diheme cytochrome c family protein
MSPRLPERIILLLLTLAFAGCTQEMANQPREETFEESAFFADGVASRPQVTGTIARGQHWDDSPENTGKRDGKLVENNPAKITSELMARGQERFNIYCSNCHGKSGYGDGLVVQRGFPAPPSYHIDRLRQVPDGRIFEVITTGFGRMPAFGARIAPADRWAIAAYLRALQLSQSVEAKSLSEDEAAKLPQ